MEEFIFLTILTFFFFFEEILTILTYIFLCTYALNAIKVIELYMEHTKK
jgi:hypothetical protein